MKQTKAFALLVSLVFPFATSNAVVTEHSYTVGDRTYTSGSDSNGGIYHNTSYTVGSQTYTHGTGRNDHKIDCTSYKSGNSTYKSCR